MGVSSCQWIRHTHTRTHHLVNHLHEFVLGLLDAFRAAFNADDVAVLVVRGNANRYSSFVLDAPDVRPRLSNDVLVVLLVDVDLCVGHAAAQVARDVLEHLLRRLHVLGRSFQLDLVLAVVELDVNLVTNAQIVLTKSNTREKYSSG